MKPWKSLGVVALAALTLGAPPARADEGMWLFTDPPRRQLQERYGFEPTPEWLLHLQQSSVRFSSGGSGSFVSPDGLVMTNHHVASDSIQKLSKPGKDLLGPGFHARTRAQEPRVPDLELNVLMNIEDVTSRVQAAVQPGMDAEAAEKARRGAINSLEKESFEKTGLRSDVVTLFRGGLYHLYRYKRYTDVRLVFAPEKDIAFFGGDPDNFEYPRYDLDVTFFRAYENGKPARTPQHLKFSRSGSKEGDLVFVTGHPGSTNRLNTVAHLEYLRDKQVPFRLDVIRRHEVNLAAYAARSPENARQAGEELFGWQNGRKARLGGLQGLQDPDLMAAKRKAEEALRRAVDANPDMKARFGDAWTLVDKTLAVAVELQEPYLLLERGYAFDGDLFSLARTLVRLTEETAKANADRLREFSESNLESVKLQLFSTAPIEPELEIVKLSDSLSLFLEKRGPRDPLVQAVLAGRSPRERAVELVRGSRLADVALRRKIAEGGVDAVRGSSDPMIALARLVDGPSRQVRKRWEVEVDEPQRQAYAKIARATQEVGGAEVYPDATFTLRLAFGKVQGYVEDGRPVPWRTTLGGAYDHARAHGSVPPFRLPQSWIRGKGKLRLETPFNNVNTADIIGGNSGSPVVDRKGELVGLIFDGNLQSLVLDYAYSDEVARAVAVDARGILEALTRLYGADALVKELRG